MNLHRLLQHRAAAGNPVRVGLVGAGKFGSMFLNQVPTMAGLELAGLWLGPGMGSLECASARRCSAGRCRPGRVQARA